MITPTKHPQPKRHSRGSSRSVLTFSNPNYNVDGTPMEPKTTIWKRFKNDRAHVSHTPNSDPSNSQPLEMSL